MEKWGQRAMLACTAGLCAVAVFCVAVRAPSLPVGGAMLAAAGFAMPQGVAAAARGYEEPPQDFPAPDSGTNSAASPAVGHSVGDGAIGAGSAAGRAGSSDLSPAFAPEGNAPTELTQDGSVADALLKGVKETTLPNSGVSLGSLWVKNSNKNHDIDISAELKKRPAVKLKRDGSVEVLLYHTHTTEAYAGVSRSRDNTRNMVAVGEELAAQLRAAGIGVVHDTACHDYPSYNGSYDRSGETIQRNLKKYPGIQVTLDIHRDAMTASDGTKYKPTAVINGQKAAQLMIISGCDDEGTLGFPDWEWNLRLALRLQKATSELYPSLARPLNFCNRKYNEHMTRGSLLVELGTEVNTLEEAKYSARLLGTAITQVLLELQ